MPLGDVLSFPMSPLLLSNLCQKFKASCHVDSLHSVVNLVQHSADSKLQL